MKKKILSVLLVLGVILSTNTTSLAADVDLPDDYAQKCDIYLPANNDDSHEYFEFTNPNARINSDGSFTFSFQREMSSSNFTPASSSITVYASATSSTSNKTYYISLWKYSTGSASDDTQIASIKYTADGSTQKYTFTGLSTSSRYYLYFSKPLTSSATITGSGRIESIK